MGKWNFFLRASQRLDEQIIEQNDVKRSLDDNKVVDEENAQNQAFVYAFRFILYYLIHSSIVLDATEDLSVPAILSFL